MSVPPAPWPTVLGGGEQVWVPLLRRLVSEVSSNHRRPGRGPSPRDAELAALLAGNLETDPDGDVLFSVAEAYSAWKGSVRCKNSSIHPSICSLSNRVLSFSFVLALGMMPGGTRKKPVKFKEFAVSREPGRGGDRENKISVPDREGDLTIQLAAGAFQQEVADFLHWSVVDLVLC